MSGIYSLVSIDKQCVDDQYIQAISYDKLCLQSMIDNLDSNLLSLADFIIKENTPVYSLLKIKTNTEPKSNICLYSVNKFDDNKLYGFNKLTSNGVQQVLLDVTPFNNYELKKKSFFKNDLSENSIVFDKYYDEGIMNA
jgi:uncharacterized membrane protein